MVEVEPTNAVVPACQFDARAETAARVIGGLRCLLVKDGVGDDLYDALNEVLAEPPPPRARRAKSALARFRPLAPRRRRPVKARPLSAQHAARLADLFRRATRQLLQVAPQRLPGWLPTEELHLLRVLRDERPDPQDPDEYMPYLRRYASALLAVLDLMGDDA